MRIVSHFTAVVSLLAIASGVIGSVGCSKSDAGSAGAASSAQAAPSSSGEEWRRGHEHEGDGGRDHGDHPR